MFCRIAFPWGTFAEIELEEETWLRRQSNAHSVVVCAVLSPRHVSPVALSERREKIQYVKMSTTPGLLTRVLGISAP